MTVCYYMLEYGITIRLNERQLNYLSTMTSLYTHSVESSIHNGAGIDSSENLLSAEYIEVDSREVPCSVQRVDVDTSVHRDMYLELSDLLIPVIMM